MTTKCKPLLWICHFILKLRARNDTNMYSPPNLPTVYIQVPMLMAYMSVSAQVTL